MKDPVRVFGRIDVATLYAPLDRTTTCIHLPDTDLYIHDIASKAGRIVLVIDSMQTYNLIDKALFRWEWKDVVMSSMVVEREYLLDVIHYCNVRYGPSARLDAWKKDLVLERIRRNMAVRLVQKQFRESVSNPGYGMCKRRLLRELAEGGI